MLVQILLMQMTPMCSNSLGFSNCRYLANKYQDKAGHLLGVGTKERALVDNWLEVGMAHSSIQSLFGESCQLGCSQTAHSELLYRA